ncbi:ABC transporter ATP-binding protein [Protaetiibacter larvae]|uniref:ABC transporter ATP-binding protein n=1 Tax=Protaetiibacter larvae TaxID=2592654 RepID=A0A5C1Y7N7_9MICO|nr:ABC transporter ATP-binding protein [Protaetiibacter larvae]QEO09289.1 ABC transporter ATP-binding protein [Protaetiibacter larvae]
MSDTATQAPATAQPLLDVDHVTIKFGGVVALDDVSFDIKPGEILGLIGPNGAGKTTAFNVITGVYQATSGTVTFDGTRLAKKKRYQITKLGIARTFQNIRLFPSMTALDNVLVGADVHSKVGVLRAIFRTPYFRRTERESKELARELLTFVGVDGRAEEFSTNLSYGDQRRLEIARALATKPKLICLDEPAAGFNPAEKQRLMQLIRNIRDAGNTVLLVEHDMKLVMGVCDRIVVLEFGKKVAEGTPAEIQANPVVIAAYLGAEEEDVDGAS